jgi:DNA-3-methyladenine glycosylase II
MTAKRPSVETRRRTALLATRYLRRADVRLARLIERIGPYCPVITSDPLVALVGSIIHQQVSMSAAAAIRRRLRKLCGGRLTAPRILRMSVEELRAVGLSRQKAAYVRNIAEAFVVHTLTAARLRRMSDDEVIAATTALKGVGRWTAEMLLIFCLERPDIWPVDDFGLRKAAQLFFGLSEMPTPAAIRHLADPWRPYRSYATWYLWRSLDGPIAPRISG